MLVWPASQSKLRKVCSAWCTSIPKYDVRAYILSLMLQLNFKQTHEWVKIYQYVLSSKKVIQSLRKLIRCDMHSLCVCVCIRLKLVRISQTFPELSKKKFSRCNDQYLMWIALQRNRIYTRVKCIILNINTLWGVKILYSAKSRQVWLY